MIGAVVVADVTGTTLVVATTLVMVDPALLMTLVTDVVIVWLAQFAYQKLRFFSVVTGAVARAPAALAATL